MGSLYEYTRQCQEEGSRANEDELIQKLNDCLDNGENIDFTFPQRDSFGRRYNGTILHYSIINQYERVVEYSLSRGANMAVERISDQGRLKLRSAIEVAFYSTDSIRRILKKRSLELYSSYGLTSFHLDCAFFNNMFIDPGQINAIVSAESPVLPNMSPILIAAKFRKINLLIYLLDLGADPIVQDREGHTPLHYVEYFIDERLFAPDPSNTFGSYNGRSHFHLACWLYPRTMNILKRYLDQGISPDLPTQDCVQPDFIPGQVGLHLAVELNNTELVQLLLEYGADIDKQDSRGDSPVEHFFKYWDEDDPEVIKVLCSLIEGGANMDQVTESDLPDYLSRQEVPEIEVFLGCVVKMSTLNENLVSAAMLDVYYNVVEDIWDDDEWSEEEEYTDRCSEELTILSRLGLLQILDDTIVINSDFKVKFGYLDSFDVQVYPIYGSLLKTKAKRKLLEFEICRKKIAEAVPRIQQLYQSYCHLPILCAENILWNFSREELDQFLSSTNEM